MKKVLVILLACAVGITAVGLAAQDMPKEKKEKKAAPMKEDRWSGTIIRSNKDASTLTVGRGNIEKTVVWNSDTKWTEGSKPAEMSAFKDGSRVICLGHYDDKGRLVATRIDLRPPR